MRFHRPVAAAWRSVAVVAALFATLEAFGAGPAEVVNAKSGIAWQRASSEAEVERAFAMARQIGKPVFLYWGAVWCPPCNQVQATLFSRADFVERSRAFVPVYVDGDKPGAQKVAARFRVSGYPTMVLFKEDGSELTRLPGEVDPERYILTLSAALDAQVPVRELVRRALGREPLTPQQWRLLAFYSWITDEQQVVSAAELGERLTQLASAAPAEMRPIRDRLGLKAVAARAASAQRVPEGTLEQDRVFIERILRDTEAAGEQSDLLVQHAEAIVRYLVAARDARAALGSRWDDALQRVLARRSPGRSVLIDALDARVSLWKLIEGANVLPSSRQRMVTETITPILRATTDRYERQAIVPSAAHVLTAAGLIDQSDALLSSELPRAVAPYYHMLGLAANAKARGDRQAALQWYERAWRKSEGPATRLQWGAGYVRQLIELTPADRSKVAAAAGEVLAALEPRGETFYERNLRALQRMAAQLAKWQAGDAGRAATVAQLRAQLARTCAKVPAKDEGRRNCEAVFDTGAGVPRSAGVPQDVPASGVRAQR